jgi:hypothetical protein
MNADADIKKRSEIRTTAGERRYLARGRRVDFKWTQQTETGAAWQL